MFSKTTQAGGRARLCATAAITIALLAAACKQEQAPATTAPEEAAQADARPAPAAPGQAVSDTVASMSPEQLREAASKAYQESRLYAPGGDNALEYYLALRDKQPANAGASSALIDLLPMTVIATEQSRDREDFSEAKRLLALIEKADKDHPAVARLKATIAAAETGAAQRAEQQQLTAEQEAERQQQLERERAEQQRVAQEQAAQALATQQAADAEAARQQAARDEAARQQAAQQQAAAPAPAASELRAISTPPPRFPPEALRAGTSGEVQVEFTVGVDGSVTSARVVRANPPRVFDREAVSAVRRWRFEPVSAPVTTRRAIAFDPGG